MKTSTSIKQRSLKLSVLAFACAAAVVSGPSSAVTANATASGTVIAPIAVVQAANLTFGKFAPGAGGTVTISTAGVRSSTGIIESSIGSTGLTAAKFTVTGDPTATYSISYGAATVLTNGGGGAPMTMTKVSDLTGGGAVSGTVLTGALSALGAQTIFVGGVLDVAADQLAGDYTGNIAVTVEYN